MLSLARWECKSPELGESGGDDTDRDELDDWPRLYTLPPLLLCVLSSESPPPLDRRTQSTKSEFDAPLPLRIGLPPLFLSLTDEFRCDAAFALAAAERSPPDLFRGVVAPVDALALAQTCSW